MSPFSSVDNLRIEADTLHLLAVVTFIIYQVKTKTQPHQNVNLLFRMCHRQQYDSLLFFIIIIFSSAHTLFLFKQFKQCVSVYYMCVNTFLTRHGI